MTSLRKVAAGGLLAVALGGAGTALIGSGGLAAQADFDDTRIVIALREIRDALRVQSGGCGSSACNDIAQIRTQLETYFKLQHEFPAYVDVGIDVWENVQDWHVANRQPMNVSRLADGRYAMSFMLTNLVLRHDVPNTHIGNGYDER
jgi:hypothetical protein